MTQAVWSVVAIVVLYRRDADLRRLQRADPARIALSRAAWPRSSRRCCRWSATSRAASIALLGSGVDRGRGRDRGPRLRRSRCFTFAVAGVACVFAAAPARAAGVLAVSAIAAAMRTDDLAEMGDAWHRMRASALAVLVAALVLALSAVGALAFGVSSRSNARRRARRGCAPDRRRIAARIFLGRRDRTAAAPARVRAGSRPRSAIALARLAVLARARRRGPADRVAGSRVARLPRRQQASDARAGALRALGRGGAGRLCAAVRRLRARQGWRAAGLSAWAGAWLEGGSPA